MASLSFPKLLRPRLQLFVLALVLGAGLLPNNSMAQDGTATKPDPDAGAGNAEGPTTDKASGRAGGTHVKCWTQLCEGSTECLQKPYEPFSLIDSCGGGNYCYHEIVTVPDLQSISVNRWCANPDYITCLKKEPGNCYKQNLTGDHDIDEAAFSSSDYEKCMKQQFRGQGKARAWGGRGTGPGTREICLCDKNLCNDKYNSSVPTSAGPTGGKHLCYNFAFVGALPVSLGRMFLIT